MDFQNKDFKIMNRNEQDATEKKDGFDIMHRTEYEKKYPRKNNDVSFAVLQFKRLKPEAELPIRGTFGSAGYDICACLDTDITIAPNQCVLVPTGFATSFRSNFVALVYSRSGLATKRGLVVAQGTAVIDSDYRGEWMIPLFNQSSEPQLVRSGDRIAQLVVQPIARVKAIEVDDLNQTKRGDGGFGSTGVSHN